MEFFAANPYFSAGAGLIGITASLAVLRQASVHGLSIARRQLFCSLEIPSKDQSYPWVLKWLSHHHRSQNLLENTKPKSWRAKLSAMISTTPQLSVETSFIKHDNGSSETNFALVPGMGNHFFKYRGSWFQVTRLRERTMIDLKSGSPWETVTLTTLSRDRALFAALLQEAKEFALSAEVGKMVVYVSMGPEWRPFGNPRRRRPIESVVLDKEVGESILNDVLSFLNNGKWYFDRGIPYRRGYLLFGPPGSGKTSYIQALAGELGYNICTMNLSERGMTDDRLSWLLSHVPARSLILLEDIDAAFVDRRITSQEAKQGITSLVTLSGLLNALDGVTSTEERIIFMTTNYIERLDPALIRPGRVDFKKYIGNASEHQIRTMFMRFFGDQGGVTQEDNDSDSRRSIEVKEKADIFVERLKGHAVSPAQLQGHFVFYREEPDDAIKNADELWQKNEGETLK